MLSFIWPPQAASYPNNNQQNNTFLRHIRCNNFGQEGHWAIHCPQPKHQCQICGMFGHLENKYWELEENTRRRIANWKSRKESPCPCCEITGYLFKNCSNKVMSSVTTNKINNSTQQSSNKGEELGMIQDNLASLMTTMKTNLGSKSRKRQGRNWPKRSKKIEEEEND